MSMYSQLLNAAFETSRNPETEFAVGDMLVELLQARRSLGSDMQTHFGSSWAPEAIADQLAYDVALIRMARHMSIDCDPGDFDPPQSERARIENALESKGICLFQYDENVTRSQEPQAVRGIAGTAPLSAGGVGVEYLR